MKDCRRKSSRSGAYAMSLDANAQRLKRRSLLFHDLHNICGGTSSYGCKQYVKWTRAGLGIAIDSDLRVVGSAGVEL
jgi:hypothetical protein